MADQAAVTTGVEILAPEAKEMIKQTHLGPGMIKLQMQKKSAYIDLQNSGRLQPATIINFNPVSLLVDDGHVPWRIPAATDKVKKPFLVEYGGKKYQASVFTVREPAFVPWIRDVHKPSDEGENPTADYDAKFILPIELMDQYRISYCDSFGRIQMGGILCFQGDVHAFTKGNTIRVPQFTTLPDRTRSYFAKETDSSKALAETLEMQKNYCTMIIQQADEYFQDDEQKKNITPIHRIWLKFALDMGWKQKTPDWMNSVLESEESCKGCGIGRTRTDAHFCKCGRPYNALASFMAGENIPESYLFALTGKDLETAMKELDRRETIKAKFRTKA